MQLLPADGNGNTVKYSNTDTHCSVDSSFRVVADFSNDNTTITSCTVTASQDATDTVIAQSATAVFINIGKF